MCGRWAGGHVDGGGLRVGAGKALKGGMVGNRVEQLGYYY